MIPKKYVFPLLAFLAPLLLRAIPEILMGPYVVGFDTMGYYVPTTLLWLRGGIDFWSFFAAAPLFYTMVFSVVFAGAPLILLLKVLPVLLHGFLGLSIYGYAKKGLNWSPKKSVAVALIGTVYFVAMRVSWDLLRNELALIFFFAALTLLSTSLQGVRSWKNYVLLSAAMMAVVLANQLAAVIMLFIFAVDIGQKLYKHERPQAAILTAVSLPAISTFLLIFYLNSWLDLNSSLSPFAGWLSLFGFSSYPSMLVSQAGFFLYCYLPLLPLALLSLKRLNNLHLRSWFVVTLFLLIIPVLDPNKFRWTLMLTYPLAFYVSDALSWVKSLNWRRFKFTLYRLALVYVVLSTAVLSVSYVTMSPENPSAYFNPGVFNGYIYQFPSSMLQNTVSITDCQDTVNALNWVKNSAAADGVLLAHRAFYGWALSTLDSKQVLLYEYDNVTLAAENAAQLTTRPIYLIWWVGDQGWHGQQNVSTVFQEMYRSGKIAIYLYTPS